MLRKNFDVFVREEEKEHYDEILLIKYIWSCYEWSEKINC